MEVIKGDSIPPQWIFVRLRDGRLKRFWVEEVEQRYPFVSNRMIFKIIDKPRGQVDYANTKQVN